MTAQQRQAGFTSRIPLRQVICHMSISLRAGPKTEERLEAASEASMAGPSDIR